MQTIIKKEFNSHINDVRKALNLITRDIENAAEICISCLKNGGKILIIGNGGSAADAQHIAAELVGRYKTDRNGLAAIALTTDTSAITSISNDYGYNHVFERQINALANQNDVLIAISTGGSSDNVILGLKAANKLQCNTIGFSGKDGGEFNNLCNLNIVVPSEDTPRIQEIHILIGHTLCQLIELEFSSK
jgi:D-sedoheptulose 7-phosphate isomerase